jgi:outer membrane protein
MTNLSRAALSAFALTLLAAAGATAQAPTKIGYVNSQRILPVAPGFSDAQQAIDMESEGVKATEQRMSDSLSAMVQEYTKVQSTLTPAQRTQREEALKSKQKEYQQRAQQMEGKVTQRQAQLVQPIMDQIRGVIDGLRAEGNYAVILDAGSQSGVVVSVDTTLDLTDKVIARLTALGPPKAAPAGTKPAVKPGAPTPAATAKPTGISRPPTPPRGR